MNNINEALKLAPPLRPPAKNFRVEIAPANQANLEEIFERMLTEGWKITCGLGTVPVQTRPNMPPDAIGVVCLFEPAKKPKPVASPEKDGQAVAVLEVLLDAVKKSLPFSQVGGLLRENLDANVAAAEAFLANG